MEIRVECYAGYRGEEEPRVLHLGERRVDIMAVIDRWLDPDHRYFRVRAYDGAIYLVRHDEHSGRWELKSFAA